MRLRVPCCLHVAACSDSRLKLNPPRAHPSRLRLRSPHSPLPSESVFFHPLNTLPFLAPLPSLHPPLSSSQTLQLSSSLSSPALQLSSSPALSALSALQTPPSPLSTSLHSLRDPSSIANPPSPSLPPRSHLPRSETSHRHPSQLATPSSPPFDSTLSFTCPRNGPHHTLHPIMSHPDTLNSSPLPDPNT